MKYVLVSLLTMSGFIMAFAQQIHTEHTIKSGNDYSKYAGNLDQLSWLVGNWRGGEGATISEEQWTKPISGGMLGMFRMVSDGKPVFYELMLLIQDSSGVKLQLKHFSHPLKGWEEKNSPGVVFDLLKVEGRKAFFDGMTYELTGADDLVIYLADTGPNGNVHEEIFHMSRTNGQ